MLLQKSLVEHYRKFKVISLKLRGELFSAFKISKYILMRRVCAQTTMFFNFANF